MSLAVSPCLVAGIEEKENWTVRRPQSKTSNQQQSLSFSPLLFVLPKKKKNTACLLLFATPFIAVDHNAHTHGPTDTNNFLQRSPHLASEAGQIEQRYGWMKRLASRCTAQETRHLQKRVKQPASQPAAFISQFLALIKRLPKMPPPGHTQSAESGQATKSERQRTRHLARFFE